MKITFLNKEREITYKDCLVVIGKIILAVCVIKVMGYYVAHVNDEEMSKMKAEIPPVVLMNGEEYLPEKMGMISRARGNFFGRCQIEENARAEEIIRYYKKEFWNNGWNYIGGFCGKEVYRDSTENDWYYFFENGSNYYICLYLSASDFDQMKNTRMIFYIRLKKEYDDRKYCKM